MAVWFKKCIADCYETGPGGRQESMLPHRFMLKLGFIEPLFYNNPTYLEGFPTFLIVKERYRGDKTKPGRQRLTNITFWQNVNDVCKKLTFVDIINVKNWLLFAKLRTKEQFCILFSWILKTFSYYISLVHCRNCFSPKPKQDSLSTLVVSTCWFVQWPPKKFRAPLVSSLSYERYIVDEMNSK